MKRRQHTFGQRFEMLVGEFGSRYRLDKASGVPESTLQQYAQARSDRPPRADILLKLARAGNVSLEWLMSGKGEMRPAGIASGAVFADVVMVELRDSGAALSMEQVVGYLPFSRFWLKSRLGLEDHESLMAIEAERGLPPLIRRSDLLLIDRTAENKRPRSDGIYVLSVARGLAVRQVTVKLNGQFLVSSPGASEDVVASDIVHLIVGEVVWRGSKL